VKPGRSHWLNIDGVACLVQAFREERLPLKSDLANQHGEGWIGKALRQYRLELKGNPSPGFLAVVKSLTGSDLRAMVSNVKAADVKEFAASLDGAPPSGRRQE
jgi:hypothetical protein